MIKRQKIDVVTPDRFFVDRTHFIGGSDIAAVMGMSRWCTPLQLWAEKTGRVQPKDLSGIESVELGSELEDFVAKKFERTTLLQVRRTPKTYIHPKYDYMRCQVDRLIVGTDELLECKTASGWKAKEWAGEEIPQEYILQVMWQLGITGRRIGHIAVLIGGQSFRCKKIEFDQELFDLMVERAIEFWQMVKDEIPPLAMANDTDFMIELYPSNDERMEDAQDIETAIAFRQELAADIAHLSEQKDEAEARIKARIGEHLGIKTQKYYVTWKSQERRSVDTEKLKADGIYDKYCRTSESRVLRVRLNGKGEGNGER